MGIDAKIDVALEGIVFDRELYELSASTGAEIKGVGLARAARYSGKRWVGYPSILTVTPNDLGRLCILGEKAGSWHLHRKIILWLLGLPRVVKVEYYGDSGDVASVTMSLSKAKEYDDFYEQEERKLWNLPHQN